MNKKDNDQGYVGPLLTEAGDVGDEQCPAGEHKTDKQEWNYAADDLMPESFLPQGLLEFLNGL